MSLRPYVSEGTVLPRDIKKSSPFNGPDTDVIILVYAALRPCGWDFQIPSRTMHQNSTVMERVMGEEVAAVTKSPLPKFEIVYY